MQSSFTACKHLLVTPILFLMLLVLHHHHLDSCHDDEDSLHSLPSAFHPDHIKQVSLSCLAAGMLSFPFAGAWVRTPDSPESPHSVLVTDPTQSRAPPSSLS